MESLEKKLLLKCFKAIEFEELCNPSPCERGKVGLVFVCDHSDDSDDLPELLESKLILARWDVDELTGESMWMEWDEKLEAWHGPVENVVGWSWLEC